MATGLRSETDSTLIKQFWNMLTCDGATAGAHGSPTVLSLALLAQRDVLAVMFRVRDVGQPLDVE
jgi:hypothetical protein